MIKPAGELGSSSHQMTAGRIPYKCQSVEFPSDDGQVIITRERSPPRTLTKRESWDR